MRIRKKEKKKVVKWATVDFNNASWNSKTLNAIFSYSSCNQFRLISTYEVAKEARDIFQIAHKMNFYCEVIQAPKAHLRFRTTMREHDHIKDFFVKLSVMTNCLLSSLRINQTFKL